jgi:hypothetical protein
VLTSPLIPYGIVGRNLQVFTTLLSTLDRSITLGLLIHFDEFAGVYEGISQEPVGP